MLDVNQDFSTTDSKNPFMKSVIPIFLTTSVKNVIHIAKVLQTQTNKKSKNKLIYTALTEKQQII